MPKRSAEVALTGPTTGPMWNWFNWYYTAFGGMTEEAIATKWEELKAEVQRPGHKRCRGSIGNHIDGLKRKLDTQQATGASLLATWCRAPPPPQLGTLSYTKDSSSQRVSPGAAGGGSSQDSPIVL